MGVDSFKFTCCLGLYEGHAQFGLATHLDTTFEKFCIQIQPSIATKSTDCFWLHKQIYTRSRYQAASSNISQGVGEFQRRGLDRSHCHVPHSSPPTTPACKYSHHSKLELLKLTVWITSLGKCDSSDDILGRDLSSAAG